MYACLHNQMSLDCEVYPHLHGHSYNRHVSIKCEIV